MVEIKRKVTLRTKTPQPEEKPEDEVTPKVKQPEPQPEPTPVPPPSTPSDETVGSKGGGNGKKWLVAAVLVALLGGGYYLYSSQGNESGNTAVAAATDSTGVRKDTTQTAQADSATKAETDTDGLNVTGKAGSKNASENNSDGEVPVSSDNTPDVNTAANAATDKQVASAGNHGTSATTEPTMTEPASSVQETANDVIKGTYGNGVTRKHKLGSRYAEVQKRVNEMYRKGEVH